MSNFLQKKLILINEYYYFRIILNVSTFFLFSFYLIFLYKTTGSFNAVLIDSIIFYIVQYLGFVVGSILTDKLGYVRTFKLSYVLQALAFVFIIINLPNVIVYYPIFAIFRSFPRGMYWSVNNSYELKEFNVTDRGLVVSTVNSISFILGIIFPTIAGALISFTGNYYLVFVIGSVILLLACFVSWNYNKKPKSQISSEDILQILRHPQFKKFSLATSINQIFDITVGTALIIIPLLFLKNEFSLGIVASAVNLCAAIFVFIRRRNKIKKDLAVGFFGNIIYVLFNLSFAYFWTIETFLIYGLAAIITSALSDPLKEKMEYRISDHIVEKNKNQLGMEMNLVRETLMLIGRVAGLSIFFIIFNYLNNDLISSLKIIVVAQALWCLIYYVFLVRMQKHEGFHEEVPSTTAISKPHKHLFEALHH